MFKKIAITAVLLGLVLAGGLIAEDRIIWRVHITAESGIPEDGTVSVVIESWPQPDDQTYDGPRDYYFTVTASNLGKEITSTVVAGDFSDSKTKIMNPNDLHANLYLDYVSDPEPEPEDPQQE